MSDDAHELPDAVAQEILETFAQVPTDFPRTPVPGAVSGLVPKLRVVKFAGRFYQPWPGSLLLRQLNRKRENVATCQNKPFLTSTCRV